MCLFLDEPGLVWYEKCYIEKIGLVWEEGDGMAINGYTYDLKVALIEGKVYGDTTLLNVGEPLLPSLNKFILSPNYPNPFNPSTTIRYEIPEQSIVTIKIYNIPGNEITTLVNEEKPAGEYEVEFNGVDLPSGIYFYRLKAEKFVETKKMVLIK